ncbi:MAG: BON domain-containing protein [Alphaproteobacteria bacterium]|nr:MAG: BON domain-containing protein [Alphaproteobacteria bacterium]
MLTPRTTFALAALLAATSLAGCAAPVVLGAAASAGYVGLQNRPAKQVAADTEVKVRVKDNLTQANFSYLTDIGIDVFYGDVLLTGVVPSNREGERVLDLVRRTPGVKKVYNEIFVGSAYPTSQKAKDAWISTQIQPRLLGAKDAYPLNYLITVVNNHVYIMGDTGTQGEKDHVIHILRTTRGVQQVHDYLIVNGSDAADTRANAVRSDSLQPSVQTESLPPMN